MGSVIFLVLVDSVSRIHKYRPPTVTASTIYGKRYPKKKGEKWLRQVTPVVAATVLVWWRNEDGKNRDYGKSAREVNLGWNFEACSNCGQTSNCFSQIEKNKNNSLRQKVTESVWRKYGENKIMRENWVTGRRRNKYPFS